jgi:hypothetical protein
LITQKEGKKLFSFQAALTIPLNLILFYSMPMITSIEQAMRIDGLLYNLKNKNLPICLLNGKFAWLKNMQGQ